MRSGILEENAEQAAKT